LTLFLASLIAIDAQGKESLRLVQTIPMPNVKGRIDHMNVKCPGRPYSLSFPRFPGGLVGQNLDPVVEPCSLDRLPYNQVAVSKTVKS
jgi:hypothetical protein